MEKDERTTGLQKLDQQQYPCYPGAINVNPTIIVNVSNDTDMRTRSGYRSESADADIANAVAFGLTGLLKLITGY